MTQQGSSKEYPLGACNEMKEALPTLRAPSEPQTLGFGVACRRSLGPCPKGLKSVRDLASGFGNKADAKDFLSLKPTTLWVFCLEWIIITALSQNMGFFPHQPHSLPFIFHIKKKHSIESWQGKLSNSINIISFRCTFELEKEEDSLFFIQEWIWRPKARTGELMLEVPRASVQPRGPVLVTHVGRGWDIPCAVESTGRAIALVGNKHPSMPTSTGAPWDCLDACTSTWEMGERLKKSPLSVSNDSLAFLLGNSSNLQSPQWLENPQTTKRIQLIPFLCHLQGTWQNLTGNYSWGRKCHWGYRWFL